tara:strand:- start:6051 stop:7097 length:1047 start_codon:yes stop_codon:yes gene_type:complete
MNQAERQLLVSKIVSGITHIEYNGKQYFVREPSLTQKYLANKIYEDKLKYAIFSGISKEEEILKSMIELGLWSAREDEKVKELTNLNEDLKVELYNAYTLFKARDSIRERLKQAREELIRLVIKKNVFRKQTAEGFADDCKAAYLLFSNITDIDGNKICDGYESQEGTFFKFVTDMYGASQATETQIRELCLNEPWRTMWGVSKAEGGIFGSCAVELTQEQRAIVAWSRVYDNVFENPDCPPDEVIKDNDMLDGWLIKQGKKRDQSKSSKASEMTSDAKGNEVYYFADSQEDAKRIYKMNDGQGRATIRNRQKEIENAQGGLAEEKTMEAKMELLKMAKEQFKSTVKM